MVPDVTSSSNMEPQIDSMLRCTANLSNAAETNELEEHILVFLDKASSLDVTVMTVMLTVVALLGSVGNTIVILVCWKFPSRQSTQQFVLAMAVCDLCVCVLIIPYRITSYHVLLTEKVCKTCEGLTYFSVLFSLFLLISIAIDRFYAVCRPIIYHKISRATAYIIAWITATSLGIAMYAGLIAGHYVDVTNIETNETEQCYTGICNEDGQDRRFSTELSVKLHAFFLGLVYVSLVITVVVCYTKVFGSLYIRYGAPQFGWTGRRISNTMEMSVTISQTGVDNNSGIQSNVVTTAFPRTNERKCSNRSSPRRNSVNHKRTAKILLLVTVVFIMTWIPFLLMKTGLIPSVVTIRLTFFFSNMINPVIYSFTNHQFRDNVVKMCRRRTSVS